MAHIKWDDTKHSINIKNFDADHKRIFEILNEMYDKMSAGLGYSVIAAVLSELKKWGIKHMGEEEELMARYSYPELELHKQEHLFFESKVTLLLERYKSGDKHLTIESYFFLKDWLHKHILETDMKYVEFFKSKGIN